MPVRIHAYYLMLLTNLNIGVMMLMAIKPTTPPRNMISSGSIIEVSPFTVDSTSVS